MFQEQPDLCSVQVLKIGSRYFSRSFWKYIQTTDNVRITGISLDKPQGKFLGALKVTRFLQIQLTFE